jgi:hypothetical protein
MFCVSLTGGDNEIFLYIYTDALFSEYEYYKNNINGTYVLSAVLHC